MTGFCYHRFADKVDPVTGKPFDAKDTEGWEAHRKAVEEAKGRGEPAAEWSPMVDNLEGGNQAMLVAEGWHTAVLRFLQVRRADQLVSIL